MEVNECYHELGLEPGCSDAEVKAAWRRLAARWHPDRNHSPQALRKIQRINRALDGIRTARGSTGATSDSSDTSPAGPVIDHTVSLTLEEVVTGCVRELRGEIQENCADCAGSGLEAEARACGECNGGGRVRQHLWFGWVSPLVQCGACQGHGATRQGCGACEGTGKAPLQKYRGRAQIPAGARAGDMIQVPVRTQPGQRGRTLMLHVRVQLDAHPLFTADADGTLTYDMPVDGFAWIANRWVEVPTPRGMQQMRLKRGSLSYRIKGAGLPWQADERPGDCLINVLPVFPEELTPVQEAAIDRLVSSNSGTKGTAAGDRTGAWRRRVERWEKGAASRRAG